MTAAITWEMAHNSRATDYLLLDRVLVTIDGDMDGSVAAVAEVFHSPDEAGRTAIVRTLSDESAGYRMVGEVRMVETHHGPATIAHTYVTRRPAGGTLLQLLIDAQRGVPL